MNIEDHPVRTCGKCSRPEARVVGVVRHLYGGNPVGETYDHTCFGCGAKFRTQSPRRLLGELSTWLVLTLVGLGIVGFGVFYVFDLFRMFSRGSSYFSVSMIVVPVLAFAVGGWLTKAGALGLRDAFAPVRAHFQNPVFEQTR
jgi:hypothetical protein